MQTFDMIFRPEQRLPRTISSPLAARLTQLEETTGDFWTFSGNDGRTGAHSLFHYPAMMVPQVQGTILDLILESSPDARHIVDPFVGSGTTLVESMYRGLKFTGIDINPLAGLLSLVKATPISKNALIYAYKALMDRIARDTTSAIHVRFPNDFKWFERSSRIHLARIVRSIEQEDDLPIRRVFWVALARCIRNVSNSRLSTYKLHQRPLSEIASRNHDSVTLVFATALEDIITQISTHFDVLVKAKLIRSGQYVQPIKIHINDAEKTLRERPSFKFDIVMTSPPYGDNVTTVPYGQYSYLPLMWIPIRDICATAGNGLLKNTHSTDTASLGGSLSDALYRGEQDCGRCKSYQNAIKSLAGNSNGSKRFAAFASDLAICVRLIASRTVCGGVHAWTIGDRNIGGQRVPMADLLIELLGTNGVEPLHSANRRILAKKMAHRNSLSRTMTAERIVIGLKA